MPNYSDLNTPFGYRSRYWDKAKTANTPNTMPDPGNGWNEYGRAAKQQGYYNAERSRLNKPVPNAKGTEVKAKGRLGGYGFGIWAGISTIGNVKSGDNFGTAIVKGFGEAMLWETAPLAMGAWQLASAMPAIASSAYNWYRQRDIWYKNQHLPHFGGGYQDTQRALTMRQAAVQAIQGSKLNARSALGGEARILSQGMYRQNTIGN